MTEWSKVLRSGRSVFARVGSNPTVCIFPFRFDEKNGVRVYDCVLMELICVVS